MDTIRHWLIYLLTSLAAWLADPPVDDFLHGSATRLEMAAQDRIDGRSGEAKRHQVLAALLKRGLSESDAAFMIEIEIQARKGRRWVQG